MAVNLSERFFLEFELLHIEWQHEFLTSDNTRIKSMSQSTSLVLFNCSLPEIISKPFTTFYNYSNFEERLELSPSKVM